jgi:3-oxoadipate enol-lactonase
VPVDRLLCDLLTMLTSPTTSPRLHAVPTTTDVTWHPARSSLSIRDLVMRYRFDGPAGAPVVVLSNAVGTGIGVWDFQTHALARRFNVLRYDCSGRGASATAADPCSIEQRGRDLLALLDVLSIGRAHFCGGGLGGMIGLWLALHASHRVDRVVVCNTTRRYVASGTSLDDLTRARASGLGAIADNVLKSWFTPAYMLRAHDEVRRMRSMLLTNSSEDYIAGYMAMLGPSKWCEPERIRRPTLVIAGTHDLISPPMHGRRLAKQIPGAQYIELDAAHMSNVEAAQRFTASLMQFLDR